MTTRTAPQNAEQQSLAKQNSTILQGAHNYTVAACQEALTVIIDEAFKKADGQNHNAERALKAHTNLLQAFKDAAALAALRAENQRLREALQRLNRAYEADSESAPDMSVRMAFETNSQAHAQARAALKGE